MSDAGTVRVRFAPSPSGRLHLGNIRAALLNWLFARKTGGHFLLRLDDTDRASATEEYARGIEEDLAWLGLAWDARVRQSDRLDRYEAAIAALKSSGRLYPCFETEEELGLKRRLAQSRHRPWVYDRAALALDAAERARRIAAGERPHWRFRLSDRRIAWTDLVRGAVAYEGTALSDPVLVRADGMPLYTLASVVDDIELGITHVVRGEDHVTNTAVQIELFEALGGRVPDFAHFALVVMAGGEMLSKREGSLSVASLRADGILPMAIASLLAKLGTSDPVEPRHDLASLAAEFDFGKLGRAQPHLDLGELLKLNARLLHETPFEAVRDRLPDGADAAFWAAVRGNLERLSDAEAWWQVCHVAIAPAIEDPDFLAEAARLLPEGPLDDGSWKLWTDRLKAATGRKGRPLFHPLRLALTGREEGPEMRLLLPLIGRDRALQRLGA